MLLHRTPLSFLLLLHSINLTTSFQSSIRTNKVSLFRPTKLFAADGPPQYDKVKAVLREAEVVGEGSVMLHVDVTNPDSQPDLEYLPGHVLALEMENPSSSSEEDAKEDWMRGPYTVSRATKDSFDILVKVVGEKTKAFAAAPANTPMRFGGKFKVPILDGVEKDKVDRLVLISTGVGVGPCIGAIELAMADSTFSPSVELFASFRTAGEIVSADHLDELQKLNPDRFNWNAIVTSETKRISANEQNLERVIANGKGDLEKTHYHVIGNGQMVNEWKAGLEKAGVPKECVTMEQYFNHKAEVDQDVIDRIAAVVSAGCAVKA